LHGEALVTGQMTILDKTGETKAFVPLLDQLDIAGAVITADALCRCRHKASYADPAVMPLGGLGCLPVRCF
jgi:hypothetical protein